MTESRKKPSTPAEIQKKSDDKRGLKVKGLKLHLDIIALLEQLSVDTGKPQATVVTEAIQMYADSLR